MYLTETEYATLTGEAAPTDFTACLSLAEAMIDGQTLQYYAQATLTALPARVLAWLKQATACQVLAISQMGGIAGATEPQGGASLGRFSTSAPPQTICAPTALLLPYLVSWARGNME